MLCYNGPFCVCHHCFLTWGQCAHICYFTLVRLIIFLQALVSALIGCLFFFFFFAYKAEELNQKEYCDSTTLDWIMYPFERMKNLITCTVEFVIVKDVKLISQVLLGTVLAWSCCHVLLDIIQVMECKVNKGLEQRHFCDNFYQGEQIRFFSGKSSNFMF